MMSKKYVIVLALLGIFLISAMVMPSYAVEANPYCDLVSDDYSGDCHDRYDFDEEVERTTGKTLYPCNDGSNRDDPKDCPDISGFDYNSSSNDEEEGEGGDDDLPQEGGCQEDDDFCDADEGCRSDGVDCVDDTEVESGSTYNG